MSDQCQGQVKFSSNSRSRSGHVKGRSGLVKPSRGQVRSVQFKVRPRSSQVRLLSRQGQIRSVKVRSDKGLVKLRTCEWKVRAISSSGQSKIGLCHVTSRQFRSTLIRSRSGHGEVRTWQDRLVQGLVRSDEFRLWQLRSDHDPVKVKSR